MHVAVIRRILQDVPLPNQEPKEVEEPHDDLPAPPVNTTSILQALWDQLADKSFKSVPKDGFVIPQVDMTVEPPRYANMRLSL